MRVKRSHEPSAAVCAVCLSCVGACARGGGSQVGNRAEDAAKRSAAGQADPKEHQQLSAHAKRAEQPTDGASSTDTLAPEPEPETVQPERTVRPNQWRRKQGGRSCDVPIEREYLRALPVVLVVAIGFSTTFVATMAQWPKQVVESSTTAYGQYVLQEAQKASRILRRQSDGIGPCSHCHFVYLVMHAVLQERVTV